MHVPSLTPVTRPVFVTVATPGAEETQGLVSEGVPSPVSWVVDPTHISGDPEIEHCPCNLRIVTSDINKIPVIFFISQWFSVLEILSW